MVSFCRLCYYYWPSLFLGAKNNLHLASRQAKLGFITSTYVSTKLETLYPFLHADPYHQDLYRKQCVFLPVLNDGSNPGRLHNQLPGTIWCLTPYLLFSHCADYKKNFLALEQLVLIGGPDDGVITPWQSRWDITLPLMPQEMYSITGVLAQAEYRVEWPDNGTPCEISFLSCDIQLYMCI